MKNYNVVIIGGGPAGLAAAVSCYDRGEKSVVIIERDVELGGVLNQCIHNGFGLTRFGENLTGPEYAYKFIEEVEKRGIDCLTDTMVLSVSEDKKVTAMNSKNGLFTIEAKSVILAMGCRERSKGALNIAGSRPAGIYSAGTAQKYVNVKGYMVGERIVILGSGDIGLIMARRLTLEGAKVLAVSEIMPYSSGLKRNIEQCLNDFNIPLYLSHTITEIRGKDRVTGVTISKVDENKNPIKGTEISFDCDTVLFSVGLIPENELTKNAGIKLSPRTKGAEVDQYRETSVKGIFACGNVLQVHDLVDFVSEESEIAGRYAAENSMFGGKEVKYVETTAGTGVGYLLPQKLDINGTDEVKLYFRVAKPMKSVIINLTCNGKLILSRKKQAVAPGEMETLKIKAEELNKFDGVVTVSVEAQND